MINTYTTGLRWCQDLVLAVSRCADKLLLLVWKYTKQIKLLPCPSSYALICGRNDMIRESHTKEIAKNIPNAKLSIMKGDHFIANKRHITFNKDVEDFLQTIP